MVKKILGCLLCLSGSCLLCPNIQADSSGQGENIESTADKVDPSAEAKEVISLIEEVAKAVSKNTYDADAADDKLDKARRKLKVIVNLKEITDPKARQKIRELISLLEDLLRDPSVLSNHINDALERAHGVLRALQG
ncbi:MAG: hypothetical protein LBF84_02605 [Holosporales bacterium]|jgi:hypothetical protein|nr:hypothetical protein [Holosporales bacterium]